MVESVTAARTQTPSVDAGARYTVKQGETLSGIAASQGVSLNALIAANPQISNPNLIRPNEHLTIPNWSAAANGTYMVKPGETLSGIAARFGLDWHSLALDNGLVAHASTRSPTIARITSSRSRP